MRIDKIPLYISDGKAENIVFNLETALRPVSIEEVNIYNIFGECVVSIPEFRATPQEGNLRVDISNLPSGIYYVRLGDWVG